MKKKSTVYCLPSTVKETGFTLVEILVSLTILAVIGFVAVPNFRQFNNDQEVTDSVSNIGRLLQQAQTSGQSQTACVNSLPLASNNPAIFWDLRVSDAHNFQLQAECIRADTGAALATTVYQRIVLSPATSIAVTYNGGTGCALPAVIQFRGSPSSAVGPATPPPAPGQVVFLSCGGTNVAALTSVILGVSHTGFPARTVTVEANGTVRQ